MRTILISSPLALVLTTCGHAVSPPIDGLHRPAAVTMKSCDPLPEIPATEAADPHARASYYATSRGAYVLCAAKADTLQAYVRILAPEPKPEAP